MKLYDVLTQLVIYQILVLMTEALERQLGRELPEYYRGEKMVGGHMSNHHGCSGVQKNEYIAYIPKSFNETKITISVSM